MKIKIVNQSTNALPQYETEHSSGLDIRANIPEGPLVLNSFQRILIPTGLYIEIPEGYEGQIRPRSGLALRNGITVLNSPGTIDSDYRGELKVLLVNLSDQSHTILHGDRIAQLIIASYQKISWLPTHELEETLRGTGGYGHTGIQ